MTSTELDTQGTRVEDVDTAIARFERIRALTEYLCEPLATEDYVVQTMPSVSPPKWHLAHTSWFFETFLLQPQKADFVVFHPLYSQLFNSYYNGIGQFFERHRRGLLSRPTVAEIYQYRRYVDGAVTDFLSALGGSISPQVATVLELGLHHERQHQELLLTDIKNIFAANPLLPAYSPRSEALTGANAASATPPPLCWRAHEGGLQTVGHRGASFAYDNESPAHQTLVSPFTLASRPVTCAEYLEFIADDGYRRPDLWLSEGWSTVQAGDWQSPLYWQREAGEWSVMTLSGRREIDLDEPVCHVSFYEADAFARWTGHRLPTEQEWEVAACAYAVEGNFVDSESYHPRPASSSATVSLLQMFGDVWEWTASPYVGYPGYRSSDDTLGEYNGKFMCNQYVLRGGSCASSQDHLRATYRNFFEPEARWQFTGIRLASDA